MINCLINKLINSQEPTESELLEAFDEIFNGVCDEISAASFVTLLKEKEDLFHIKSMCLSCAIKSARTSLTKIKAIADNFPTFEILQFKNCFEYFDISFLMDIILASNDVLVSKYILPFQKNQSFETLKIFNILSKNIDDNFYEDFEKTNFVYLNISAQEPYYKYSSNILKQLPFDNVLNLTSKFLNPLRVKNQFVCVNDKKDVEKFANVCLNIGNQNSLILSSNNDLPFASVDRETYVAEAWKNKIFTYALSPELLGLNRFSIKELKIENSEHNKEIILNILDNKEKGAIYECCILNSALALYIVKKADSILDGINKAKHTIKDGLAKEKLEQLKKIYS